MMMTTKILFVTYMAVICDKLARSETKVSEWGSAFLADEDWTFQDSYECSSFLVASQTCMNTPDVDCPAFKDLPDKWEVGSVSNCSQFGIQGTKHMYNKQTYKQVEANGFVWTQDSTQEANTQKSYSILADCHITGPPPHPEGCKYYQALRNGLISICPPTNKAAIWEGPGDPDWEPGPDLALPSSSDPVFDNELVLVAFKGNMAVMLLGQDASGASRNNVFVLGKGGDYTSWFHAADFQTRSVGVTLISVSSTEMMALGGDTGGHLPNILIYDLATDIWTRKADFPRTIYKAAGASTLFRGRETVLVYGGQGNNKLYGYDIATDAWTDLGKDNPFQSEVSDPIGAISGGKLVFMGGANGAYVKILEVTAFDLEKEEWERLEDSVAETDRAVFAFMKTKALKEI